MSTRDTHPDVIHLLGKPGGIIAFSKGQYRWDNPTNVYIPNARVIASMPDIGYRLLWWGDLDLTVSWPAVLELAAATGWGLYVCFESSGDRDAKPDEQWLVYTAPDGSATLREEFREVYTLDGDRPRRIPQVHPQVYRTYSEDEFEPVTTEEQADEVSSGQPFDGIDSECSPLVNWYSHLSELTGHSQEELLHMWIPGSDYRELQRLVSLWIEAYHPYASEYRKHSELSMYMFQYAPTALDTGDPENPDPDWVYPGMLYKRRKRE